MTSWLASCGVGGDGIAGSEEGEGGTDKEGDSERMVKREGKCGDVGETRMTGVMRRIVQGRR